MRGLLLFKGASFDCGAESPQCSSCVFVLCRHVLSAASLCFDHTDRMLDSNDVPGVVSSFPKSVQIRCSVVMQQLQAFAELLQRARKVVPIYEVEVELTKFSFTGLMCFQL